MIEKLIIGASITFIFSRKFQISRLAKYEIKLLSMSYTININSKLEVSMNKNLNLHLIEITEEIPEAQEKESKVSYMKLEDKLEECMAAIEIENMIG